MTRTEAHRPWVGLAGLGTAWATTLIGVFMGFDPDVILLRAAIAGVGVAVAVGLGKAILVRFLRSE